MSQFFTTIPGIIISIGGILAVAVIGLGYVIGLWKKNKDGQDDRLIGILEKTVKELSTKVDNLEKREKELTREVEGLRTDNKKYIEILQGRDQQTQEFYRQAFDAMKTSKETFELVKAMAQGMTDTNKNIDKLIDLIGKHADVIDHSITSNKQ